MQPKKGSYSELGDGCEIVSKRMSVCCVSLVGLLVAMVDIVRVIENPCLKAGKRVFEVGRKICVKDVLSSWKDRGMILIDVSNLFASLSS